VRYGAGYASTQSDDHPSASLAAIGMSSWQTFQGTVIPRVLACEPQATDAMPLLQIDPLLGAAVVTRLLLVSLHCRAWSRSGYYDRTQAALKAADAALMNAQSAGRQTVAEFRQSWMDKVIDALSEYHPILTSIGDDHCLSAADHMKLTALWTRLELLLKPDEAAAASLLNLADAARLSKTAAERDHNARDMVQLARRLLKTEWVTIQIEPQ
jgi:hypothetical protein